MARSVHELLPQILQRPDDWRLELVKRWSEVVGPLKTRISLVKVYDSTAVIGVYESHWMQELYLLSDELCDSINRLLDEPRITELRFTLVEQRPERTVSHAPKTKKKGAAPIVLSGVQRAALRKVQDAELQAALKIFWGRCAEKTDS